MKTILTIILSTITILALTQQLPEFKTQYRPMDTKGTSRSLELARDQLYVGSNNYGNVNKDFRDRLLVVIDTLVSCSDDQYFNDSLKAYHEWLENLTDNELFFAMTDLFEIEDKIENQIYNFYFRLEHKGKTDSLLAVSMQYWQRGKYDEALRLADDALRVQPEYLPAWYRRAFLYEAKGYLWNAILEYNKIIKLDSDQPNAYYYKGKCFYRIKRYDEARTDFLKLKKLNADKYNLIDKGWLMELGM